MKAKTSDLTKLETRALKFIRKWGPTIIGISPMSPAADRLVDKGLVRYSRRTECHMAI